MPCPVETYVKSAFLTILLVSSVLSSGEVRAQTGSAESDSLRFYELSEIVVGGTPEALARVGSVRRVPLAEIVRTDAADVAGLARLLPSAHLQTNSRGESLIYLRSSGERQVAIFLDGALLNVPWDNRVDLSVIPASILGGLQVTEGAGSVLYGTNVLGGVVDLSTRSLQGDGSLTEATLAGGTGAFGRMDAMHVRRRGKNSFIASVGLNKTDGFRLGRNADLAFSQANDGLRLNTDRKMGHAYVRAGRSWTTGQLGVSVLHVDASKGVAPEGHLDPASGDVRFWRYPDWTTSMFAANLRLNLAGGRTLRGSAWFTRFEQRIEQYLSGNYDAISETQEDQDATFGMRTVLEQPLFAGTLRSAFNLLVSGHDQREGAVDSNAPVGNPGITLGPASSYRQYTLSAGSEYGVRVRESRFVFGLNVDHFAPTETADKPTGDAFSDWGATASLERSLNASTVLQATVGRKVRFPTMRELYGTALNRFLLNEDLRPESALLADVGLRHEGPLGLMELTAFVNRTRNTIDQRNVDVDGERRRERINLNGSRVLGIEAVGDLAFDAPVSARYSLTVTNAVVLGDSDRDRLVEKPSVLATLTLVTTALRGSTLSAEAVYTGRAYGLDSGNNLVGLPKVLQLHVRASRRYYSSSGLFVELFVRVDNLTDRSVLPQLGLPGPGRMVQAGLSAAF
ncbi:MAG: iron complex outermembrane receptor protein [Rhodothermales bacterium]|jgi:iron complex outermembrane receptor protein